MRKLTEHLRNEENAEASDRGLDPDHPQLQTFEVRYVSQWRRRPILSITSSLRSSRRWRSHSFRTVRNRENWRVVASASAARNRHHSSRTSPPPARRAHAEKRDCLLPPRAFCSETKPRAVLSCFKRESHLWLPFARSRARGLAHAALAQAVEPEARRAAGRRRRRPRRHGRRRRRRPDGRRLDPHARRPARRGRPVDAGG
jgi:hypothetical protein